MRPISSPALLIAATTGLGSLIAFSAGAGEEKRRPVPGALTPGELSLDRDLEARRLEFVSKALEIGRRHRDVRYRYGGADPAKGGVDCSGATYFIMREAGLKPPRTSAAQYDWVKAAGDITPVPEGIDSLDGPAFEKLRPGDLLFWTGTYQPTDGRKSKVTHVQLYLGREKEDGKHVMIGASDGRTYRGVQRDGFGVFELRLPRKGSKSRLLGFGSPVGLLGGSKAGR